MGQTKTTRSISATGLFLLIMMTVGLYSCTRTQKDIIPSADYAPYVNAYTGGVISQNSTIRIELTHDQLIQAPCQCSIPIMPVSKLLIAEEDFTPSLSHTFTLQ